MSETPSEVWSFNNPLRITAFLPLYLPSIFQMPIVGKSYLITNIRNSAQICFLNADKTVEMSNNSAKLTTKIQHNYFREKTCDHWDYMWPCNYGLTFDLNHTSLLYFSLLNWCSKQGTRTHPKSPLSNYVFLKSYPSKDI